LETKRRKKRSKKVKIELLAEEAIVRRRENTVPCKVRKADRLLRLAQEKEERLTGVVEAPKIFGRKKARYGESI
jgi:hypothetical protein